MTQNWENKDFVFEFPPGNRPSRTTISFAQTRHNIWMEQKPKIIKLLQKWIDDGWEPIGDIDESGFRWRTYKQIHIEPMHVILIFLVIGIFLVILDILSPWDYEEVVEYRLAMRRLIS